MRKNRLITILIFGCIVPIDSAPPKNFVFEAEIVQTTTENVGPTHPMDNPDWLPPKGPHQERKPEFWLKNGQSMLDIQLEKNKQKRKIAKNVIIFLGDGMSITTLAATRVYMGGENETMSFEKFPYTGLAKTYCINYQVADSACTATAIMTGVKSNYGVVSMSGSVDLMNCTAALDEQHSLDTIIKWAQKEGRSTGVVTTTRITHATPSTAYAHSGDREWEDDSTTPKECDDIAKQLIFGNVGQKLNVIMGGGARGFYPNTFTHPSGQKGKRKDSLNLVDEWLKIKKKNNSTKAAFVENKKDLLKADVKDVDYLFGLFSFSHMDYHLQSDKEVQPTLNEMVAKALEVLKKNEKGYVLFVEGGRIDQAHHETLAQLAFDETIEFHKAVDYSRKHTNEEDTLILATADHSHTLTMGGYPERGNNILATGDFARYDKMNFFTLTYANGPSYPDHINKDTGGRVNPEGMDYMDLGFRHPAAVPYEDETHGGDDVAVFASGPWAHIFTGSYEQNYIAHGLLYAACLGPDNFRQSDECKAYKGSGAIFTPISLLAQLLLAIIAFWFRM